MLALALAISGLLTWFAPRLSGAVRNHVFRRCWGILPVIFLVIAAGYVLSPVWLDHGEAAVACISSAWNHGQPMYHHPTDAPYRYSLLYGPNVYAAQAWFLRWFGDCTLAAKLPGLLAALVACGLTFSALRRLVARASLAVAAAWFSASLLFFSVMTFWDRPDSYLLLCGAMGLWACTLRRSWAAGLVWGLALGIAINLKITSGAILLPSAGLCLQRHGLRALPSAAVAAIAAAVTPFVALEGISWQNYLQWIRLAGRHGLSGEIFLRVAEWGLFIGAGVAVAALCWQKLDAPGLRQCLRRHRIFVFCCLASAVLVALPASKRGSGAHNFIGFLPLTAALLGFAGSRILAAAGDRGIGRPIQAAVLALGLAAAALAIWQGADLAGKLIHRNNRAIQTIADIRQALQEQPQPIAMGVGETSNSGKTVNYGLTFYRTELVFAGQPYVMDAPALMDMDLSGLPVPPATIEMIRQRTVKTWLIPKGQAPFSMESFYRTSSLGRPLFSEEFRRAFLDNYEATKEYGLFTAYTARPTHTEPCTR